jgi:hypothetical protein
MNKTQQLSQYESQCCTYLPLGMETLNMLEYLSANEPGPFCTAVKRKSYMFMKSWQVSICVSC